MLPIFGRGHIDYANPQWAQILPAKIEKSLPPINDFWMVPHNTCSCLVVAHQEPTGHTMCGFFTIMSVISRL